MEQGDIRFSRHFIKAHILRC